MGDGVLECPQIFIIIMLAKIVPFVLSSALAGTYYYLRQNPLPLDNPHLARVFTYASQKKPEYALRLFKAMLKMKIIQPNNKLRPYVLASGFDVDGTYLQEISLLGFGGMEVGPISLNPTSKEQQDINLGIRAALAKIYSHRQSRAASDPFEVQLKVVPNYQVVKYVPYLIRENLLQSIEAYCQIQKLSLTALVTKINIAFDHPQLQLSHKQSPQVRKMVAETKSEIAALVKDLEVSAELSYPAAGQPSQLSVSQLLSILTGQSPL